MFFIVLLPFLNTDVTSADLSVNGKVPNFTKELTNRAIMLERKSDVIFNTVNPPMNVPFF